MKKASLLIMCMTLLISCQDFLDPKQINLVYNEVFWQNQAEAEAGLMGCYALYRTTIISNDRFFKGDATTGLWENGYSKLGYKQYWAAGDYSNPASGEKGWGQIEHSCSWGSYYKIIAQCNMALENVAQIPDNKFEEGAKDQIMGELYFLRCITYFDLIRIWGNVPLYLESIESSEQVIDGDSKPLLKQRTDKKEVLELMLVDIDKAIGLLEFNKSQTGMGIRANKAAALVLAADMCLWMDFLHHKGGESINKHWVTKAVQLLEEMKKDGGYELVSYKTYDIYNLDDNEEISRRLFWKESKESVFEINIKIDQSESYRADMTGIQSLTCVFKPLSPEGIQYDKEDAVFWIPYKNKPLIYPEYNFEDNTGDVRPDVFFNRWDAKVNTAYGESSNKVKGNCTWLTKFNLMKKDNYASIYEYIPYFADSNIPVYRYTDALLLLAEAYYKNGEMAEANAALNEIRDRAGLSLIDNADMDDIMQQRISELIGEGKLFYDFIRNNYWPIASAMSQERYRNEGYYWPVSGTILTDNKLIKQTPYWNGKTKW